MNNDNEDTLQEKQEIIKKEILDNNYDTEKFLSFIKAKKADGDDLEKWTIDELTSTIKEFINVEKENTKKEEIKQQDIEKLTSEQAHETTKVNEVDIQCRKLEKTLLNDRSIKVLIQNPKVKGNSFLHSSFVSYEVVTASLEWCVNRRFSDFDWLRSILVKCYPHRLIPPLPPKQMGAKRFEKNFIEIRMLYLQKFIDQIMEYETLKTSEALVVFLSMLDRNQFETKMKELTGYQPSNYVQDIRTITGKLQAIYDENNDKYYRNIANFMRLQNEALDKLDEDLNLFYVNIKTACKSLEAVQKDFETLHRLNTKVAMRPEITKAHEELGIFIKNWKRIVFKQNEIIKSNLTDFFKFVHLEGLAYYGLLDNRSKFLITYDDELEKLMEKKESLWYKKDFALMEIDTNWESINKDLFFQNKKYAMSLMCTKDSLFVENLHKQLGYMSKMIRVEFKKKVERDCRNFTKKIQEFAEEFYPSLTDGIAIWSTLSNYL